VPWAVGSQNSQRICLIRAVLQTALAIFFTRCYHTLNGSIGKTAIARRVLTH
jgi:hypothetical protein